MCVSNRHTAIGYQTLYQLIPRGNAGFNFIWKYISMEMYIRLNFKLKSMATKNDIPCRTGTRWRKGSCFARIAKNMAEVWKVLRLPGLVQWGLRVCRATGSPNKWHAIFMTHKAWLKLHISTLWSSQSPQWHHFWRITQQGHIKRVSNRKQKICWSENILLWLSIIMWSYW